MLIDPIVIAETGDEPITLAEAADNMHIDQTDDSPPTYEEADRIVECIQDAREFCENEAKLSLIQKTLELRLPRFPHSHHLRHRLMPAVTSGIALPLGPVRSITSVKYYDADGNDTTLDASKYRFTPSTRNMPAVLLPVYGESWPSARHDFESVRIRYEAGYPIDDDSPAVEVPGPIRRAMLLLISHFFNNRDAVDADKKVPLELGVESMLQDYRQELGV